MSRHLAALALVLGLLAAAATAMATTPPPVKAHSAHIERLVAADQADRAPGSMRIDWAAVRPRDSERRAEVLRLLRAGEVRTARDHHSAALVLQHGDTSEDYRLAHALATVAATLDPANDRARWLQAATWDRLMLALGRKQWYGTQFRQGKDGAVALQPVEPGAVTDADRAAFEVPRLAEAEARAQGRYGALRDSDGDATCFPPDFREQILERARDDQAARRALLADTASKPLHAAALAVDQENTRWLRPIVATCGWPRQSDIGEQAARDVWLIAQHADMTPDFQLEAAAAMHRRALEGEAVGERVALLVDRHARLQSIPQTYGMQFSVDDGVLRFLPIDAAHELDARRAEIGLPTFACWAAEVAISNDARVEWPEGLEPGDCPAVLRAPAPRVDRG